MRWVAPFHPAYRIETAILAHIASGAPDVPVAFNVVAFEEGRAAQERIAGAVRAAGGHVDTIAPDHGGRILVATLTRAQLVEVARSDDVQWIDRVLSPVALMDIVRPFHGVTALESGTGDSGQGVSGEVLDWGTQLTHQDFDGIQQHPGQNVTGHDHGTCTYGIVFGNGDRDGDGDVKATGMMPSGTGWAGQLTTMGNRKLFTEDLVHAPMNCVFQSNSWATGLTGSYNSYSYELDDIAFSFDLPITQAMANSSLNTLVSSQAWAKDVIAVGGIQHQDTLTPSDDTWGAPGCPDCASTGPAEDGSIKPDLASFYENIYTTDQDPGGYSGGPYCTNFGGTSAATAITAGAVGLLHQMWADNLFGTNPAGTTVFEKRPHAVTVRAILQNQAFRYPVGFPGAGMALRSQQGWGLANLQNLLAAAPRMNVIDETRVLTVGTSATYCMTIPAGTPDLRITMSYLDPPGTLSSTEHRINDLSLVVTDPAGTAYYGNHGLDASNLSTPGGAKDAINVTENVLLDNPTPGDWTIEVSADEINEDSHTETSAMDADFALVVTGVRCPNLACCGSNVDLMTGPGPGAGNAPNVRGFNADGTANGLTDFLAYGVSQFGVNVAMGNVRNTILPVTDLLTGPGPGAVFGPQVRAFAKDGTAIGKVNFYAYGTLKYGVGAAAGDVEADGYEEILTAPGPGAVFGPHVRGFNFDNGAVTAIGKISFYAFSTLKFGAHASAASIDGDPFAEILATPGPSAAFGANVRAFNYDGAAIQGIAKVSFIANAFFYGARAVGGDLDNDGIEEIVTAPGPDPAATARIQGWNYDGTSLAAIASVDFDGMPGTLHGATAGSIDLDDDGFAEIVIGTGSDPAAPPHVRGFDYDGASIQPIAALDFDAYAAAQPYGVNVAADEVGF
ncbi:MAG: S8 family serine peptidase [Acidobacteriota bacterium]